MYIAKNIGKKSRKKKRKKSLIYARREKSWKMNTKIKMKVLKFVWGISFRIQNIPYFSFYKYSKVV